MATTKTLTPTNQQITIAAFSGEKPDQRQIADAETKMADAVNELYSQIVPQLVDTLPYAGGTYYLTTALTVDGETITAYSMYNLKFRTTAQGGDVTGTVVNVGTGRMWELSGTRGAFTKCARIATKSELSFEDVTLTAGTNITINWQRCKKNGEGLTILEVTFTAGAAISAGSSIMTGAPGIGGNMQFFTAVSDGGAIIPLGISGGAISARASISSGTKVRFIVSYFWTT